MVGPFYGMLGLALSLYFASQGAGRLAWPLAGNLVRLAIAAAGGANGITDPVEWQRELRADRPLPGRTE